MKLFAIIVTCLLLGVGVGWYLGYTRPTAKNQRKLLNEYQIVRDNFHMSDADMEEFAKHRDEYFAAMKREDEFAAAVALNVFRKLGAGEVEKAKKTLALTIATYYRPHLHDGNTNLIAKIQQTAATNALISFWLTNKLE